MGFSLRWVALLGLAPHLSFAAGCEETRAPTPAKTAPTAVDEDAPPVKRSRERPTAEVDASFPTNSTAATAPDAGNPGVPVFLPNGMLTPNAVLSVVRAQTPMLKKTCWDIDGGATQNANAQLSIVIGVDGHVHSTSVKGDEPVASCIAAAASVWTFPSPQVETPVNIPFRFVKR
jgi:hypothetical protein